MKAPSFLLWYIVIGVAFIAMYEAFLPGVLPSSQVARTLGLSAFFLLSTALLIGPLVTFWPRTFALLIEPRRAVGLSAFTFMLAHFVVVFLTYFNGQLDAVLALFQVAIALPALLIFALVASVSNDWSIRKLGNPTWKTIQRLVYVGFVIVLTHYYLNQSGLLISTPNGTILNLAEAFVWIAAIVTILFQIAGFIVTWRRKHAQPPQNPENFSPPAGTPRTMPAPPAQPKQ